MDSNHRHPDLQSGALPTELQSRRIGGRQGTRTPKIRNLNPTRIPIPSIARALGSEEIQALIWCRYRDSNPDSQLRKLMLCPVELYLLNWSERQDSNLRPRASKAPTLTRLRYAPKVQNFNCPRHCNWYRWLANLIRSDHLV